MSSDADRVTFCPECGTDAPWTARFCNDCGAALHGPSMSTPTAPPLESYGRVQRRAPSTPPAARSGFGTGFSVGCGVMVAIACFLVAVPLGCVMCTGAAVVSSFDTTAGEAGGDDWDRIARGRKSPAAASVNAARESLLRSVFANAFETLKTDPAASNSERRWKREMRRKLPQGLKSAPERVQERLIDATWQIAMIADRTWEDSEQRAVEALKVRQDEVPKLLAIWASYDSE